ncbi:MAG: response regulator [Pirellulales bacterium]
MKRTLIDHLNHEIRSPMTVIVGMTDLLLLSQLTGEQRQCLTTIKQAADSLVTLMNDAVEFSRLEAGTLSLASEEFNLPGLLDEVGQEIAAGQPGAGTAWTVRLGKNVPQRVTGDADRLKQVVSQIARQAARSGNRRPLVLDVAAQSRAGRQIELSFSLAPKPNAEREEVGSDEAPAPAVQTTQVRPADWSRGSGRGHGGQSLGLALAAGLVQRMGGQLFAPLDRAAAAYRFTARLALPDPQARRLTMADLAGEESPPPEPVGEPEPLRVLVAEDAPASQKLIERLLAGRGHSVVLAADGRQAVEAFQRQPFDLVLLDLEMPVLDGWQAADEIRRLQRPGEPRPALVALTGHRIDDVAERASPAGIDAVIGKPFDIEQFCKLVESLGFSHRKQVQAARIPGAGSTVAAEAGGTAIVDYRGALARLGGSTELFDDMARFFFEDSPGLFADIRRAIEAEDGKLLQRAAHSLKGLASNFGARCVVEAALELERIGAQGGLDQAPPLCKTLEDQLERLEEELKNRPPGP